MSVSVFYEEQLKNRERVQNLEGRFVIEPLSDEIIPSFSYEVPSRFSPKVVLGITLSVFIVFTLVFEFAYKGIF